MEYSFTLFEPRKERAVKTNSPLVEVRANGRIVFNKTATELLSAKQFCMLGFDTDNKTLGIIPLDEARANAFPVRYAAKGAYIGAKKFFRHFAILPEQAVENTPFQVNDYIAIKLN
ncbi:MAG: hypothetical protein E6X17_15555 [Sporomusaceae bacterium]|nr:hypothetical protein [Sporomusaceae bacterium]